MNWCAWRNARRTPKSPRAARPVPRELSHLVHRKLARQTQRAVHRELALQAQRTVHREIARLAQRAVHRELAREAQRLLASRAQHGLWVLSAQGFDAVAREARPASSCSRLCWVHADEDSANYYPAET